jgi:hypothetical protein
MNNISERDAFEAWAKKQGRRFNEGDLQNAKSWALAAWMARAAAQQDEPSTGICFFCGEPINGEHESDCPQAARAASTSANVAQYRNEALSALLVDHSHAASAKDVDAVLKARDAIYSMFANVAQGAEAVQFVFPPMPQAVVMHEKLGPLFDRLSMQFYADKCMRIAAPPAQTALTDDARDAARWRWFTQNYGALNLHEKFAGNTPRVFTRGLKGRSWDEITRTIDAALTAAQSASASEGK